jgi:hypothetical protein
MIDTQDNELVTLSNDTLSHLLPQNHLDGEYDDLSSLAIDECIGWDLEDDNEDEQELEDSDDDLDEESARQHCRHRRHHRRNEPSAGQRATAMAGNIIELINEACDLIHWIASVWLIGYYI